MILSKYLSETSFFIFRDTFPDYIKNRLLFRYHIYRTLYFLEQGSVKGVKKEVAMFYRFRL